MSAGRLEGIFESIAPPIAENPDKPIYAVLPITGYKSYFVGKDREGHACLLISGENGSDRFSSPIRLENLDVQFELRCHVKRANEDYRSGLFTVIRCRSAEGETVRYFLSICETIVAIVGDKPRQPEIASAVHRLASIFQKLQKPATRPVAGLFGELYMIWRSATPSAAINAWRMDDMARFDFAERNVRMDVKTVSGRARVHSFSYDQCNPPPGTLAIVASLFLEQSPGGLALRSLIQEIEVAVAAFPDLILKLHNVVTSTLGADLTGALSVAFDARLAESSLRFYDLTVIPAIRGSLPGGVSDVHFRSDLSGLSGVSSQTLIEREPDFEFLLPHDIRI